MRKVARAVVLNFNARNARVQHHDDDRVDRFKIEIESLVLIVNFPLSARIIFVFIARSL